MELLKSILLFPIRLAGGVFWVLWSLSFQEYYRPKAPLFFGNADQSVIYQTTLGRGRHEMVTHNFQTQQSEVVFESEAPVHLVGLRYPDELDLYQPKDEGWLCTVINLQTRHETPPVKQTLVGPLRSDQLLPKTLGLVVDETVCTDDECFTEIRMIAAQGSQIIGHRIPGRIESGPLFSPDEEIIAYSDGASVQLSYLRTGEQTTFPLPHTVVCNWSNTHILLACCRSQKRLFLIDSQRKEVCCVEVPEKGVLQHGSISPSGSNVAYWLVTQNASGPYGTVLAVYSQSTHAHTRLVERAKILDVQWSPHEHYLSIAGIKRRDLFDFAWGYKMRNATVCDKEVIRLDGTHVVDLV